MLDVSLIYKRGHDSGRWFRKVVHGLAAPNRDMPVSSNLWPCEQLLILVLKYPATARRHSLFSPGSFGDDQESGYIPKMCPGCSHRAVNRAETRGDINLFILKRSNTKMINLVTERRQQD